MADYFKPFKNFCIGDNLFYIKKFNPNLQNLSAPSRVFSRD